MARRDADQLGNRLQSGKRLRDLEARLSGDEVNQLGKKEILQLTRERDKLELTRRIKEAGDCQTCCSFWTPTKKISRY